MSAVIMAPAFIMPGMHANDEDMARDPTVCAAIAAALLALDAAAGPQRSGH